MKKIYTTVRLSSLAFFALFMFFATNGCSPADKDPKSTPAYKLGYDEGRVAGKVESDNFKNGYAEGYATGYQAVRPGVGNRSDGFEKFTAIVISLLGFLKIAAVITWFLVTLIWRSASEYERSAKLLATALAFVVLFWLESSLKVEFRTLLENIFLRGAMPTLDGKIFWGMVGALGAYSLFAMAISLVKITRSKPAYEVVCVFFASFVLMIILEIAASLVRVPDLSRYLFSDIMIGVATGGLLFLIRNRIQAAAGGLEAVDQSKAMGRN